LPFDIIVVKAFYNGMAKKREDIHLFSFFWNLAVFIEIFTIGSTIFL